MWRDLTHTTAYLYFAVWSNVFAPNAWTVVGLLLSHLGLRRLAKRHHDEHMQALNDRRKP